MTRSGDGIIVDGWMRMVGLMMAMIIMRNTGGKKGTTKFEVLNIALFWINGWFEAPLW